MRSTIGIYEERHHSVIAAGQLKDFNFPMSLVSIIGSGKRAEFTEYISDEIISTATTTDVRVETAIGSTHRVLAEEVLYVLHGGRFLFAAGAIAPSLYPLDRRLICGEIVVALSAVNMKPHHHFYYHQQLEWIFRSN